MIYHDVREEHTTHLPPWRLAVCLDCQHCFDGVSHERCPACESKRAASLDVILDNWHLFRKGPPPG